jgi:hypothetical protein
MGKPHQWTIMGTKRHQGMVSWPIQGPLPTIQILLSQNQAIRVNGSAQFFPQHCKLPTLSPTQHAKFVTDKLFKSLTTLNNKTRKALLKHIAKQLEAIIQN